MPSETETEEPRTDYEQQPHDPGEFEGGPVKTFLEHLEDLRWVLIKTIAAIGVAFVICLFAGPYVIAILKYPLTRAIPVAMAERQSGRSAKGNAPSRK